MTIKLISNNSYYRETFIYFFLLLSLLNILLNNLSAYLYISRDIFTIPLKIITILSIFIYFFLFDKLKKNYRENIFISFVLSCFVMSILSKINYELNFNTLLYYFKFFFLFISCFSIYYVFKNANLKKKYLNIIKYAYVYLTDSNGMIVKKYKIDKFEKDKTEKYSFIYSESKDFFIQYPFGVV
jgi:hypothetical protein